MLWVSGDFPKVMIIRVPLVIVGFLLLYRSLNTDPRLVPCRIRRGSPVILSAPPQAVNAVILS